MPARHPVQIDMSLALRSSMVLRGFNVHHGTTVIRQGVDLGELARLDSRSAGPGFADRFAERFGGLRKLPRDEAHTAAFVERLRSSEGVPFAEVLLQAILAVEYSAAYVSRWLGGIPVAEVVPGLTPEQPLLVWGCRHRGLSRRAAEVGLLGLDELLPEGLRRPHRPPAGGYDAAYASLKAHAVRRALSHNRAILIHAAETRKIPWESFDPKVVRLGEGRFQHVFYNSITERTSFVAQRTAHHKDLTSRVLADHGIPVPKNSCPASVEDAVTAASDIGYPVVIKPVDGTGGAGVCVGVRSAEEVPRAFKLASKHGSGVMVESFVKGEDHRLLVVDGRLVAATKRVRPSVTGDGNRTIRDLLEELNADPRRDGFTLVKVHVTEELRRLLAQAGYDLDTVLPLGESFAVRSMSNYHAGGYTIDVTDVVHPDNREIAIFAAKAVGLDVAGVDFLTPDVSRSHKQVPGAIIEVNGRPGFDLHTWPAEGKPRDVAGAVIEMVIPPGQRVRVPVAVIAGAKRDEPAARALDAILRAAGKNVALVGKDRTVASVNGIVQGARQQSDLRSVLSDKRVEVLVRAASPRRAARYGLFHEACDVAALMNPKDRAWNDEERQGLRVIVGATSGIVAVPSDSVDAVVRNLDSSRVVLVSLDAGDAAVGSHVEAGGLGAVLSGDDAARTIVLRDRRETLLSVPLEHSPLPTRPHLRLQAQMFAVVLAHGLGLSAAEILAAMRQSTEASSAAQAS